jgi:hypothetical protein
LQCPGFWSIFAAIAVAVATIAVALAALALAAAALALALELRHCGFPDRCLGNLYIYSYCSMQQLFVV